AASVPSVLSEKITTFGPPPWSGQTTNSARPSPVKSPAATNAPPVKFPPNGSVGGTSTVVLSAPLITITRAGTPGPVTKTRSATPSPLTSAEADRATPPVPLNAVTDWPVEG